MKMKKQIKNKNKNKNNMTLLPTTTDIKSFLRDKPRATVLEIRNHFHQEVKNNMVYSFGKEGDILAFDMSDEFFEILLEVIRDDEVCVEHDTLAHLISDNQHIDGLFPIVLTLK